MSTSLLYHGFGLSGYRYVHQKFERGEIIFRVRPKGELYQCPVCKSTHIVRRGTCIRKLRSVPIGFKPVWIEVEIPRVYCTKCNCVRQIHIRFARPRKSYTRAFERYVIELSRVMTIQDIAKLLQISWDCVKDIVKNRLLIRFSRPSLRNVKYIGIDEISVKKGHKYLTVVMDIEKGNIIWQSCLENIQGSIKFYLWDTQAKIFERPQSRLSKTGEERNRPLPKSSGLPARL